MTAPKSKPTASKSAPQKAVQVTEDDTRRIIRVEDGYRGRPSKEQHIAPGLYFEGDPDLYNCESLLVRNGLAHWVEGVSRSEMKALQDKQNRRGADVPDGFRGQPVAEGQKSHGLMSPAELEMMNKPGWEPEPDRDEDGNTLPPAPDGFKRMVVNSDGSQAEAGSDEDETDYAPEGQRPIIGTSNPENRAPVAPVVTTEERQRVKSTDK